MAAGYTISIDTHNVSGAVDAFGSATYLCSAALAFSPVSALSSFKITDVFAGGQTDYFTVSVNKVLPFTVVNGVTNSILFNVSFNNSTPTDTTLAYLASTWIYSDTPQLSAGSGDVLTSGVSARSTVFTVSGNTGWRGEEGGRIWPTHAEHIRLRNLGYI